MIFNAFFSLFLFDFFLYSLYNTGMQYYSYVSSCGSLRASFDGDFLCGVDFKGFTADYKPLSTADFNAAKLTTLWFDEYFSGKIPDFLPPIKYNGTDFQKIVWDELLKIPYGKTVSYGELARVVALKRGKTKMSAQAIGGAVGNNHICIIVPCHRVIGKDGSLVGYGEGIDKKILLLRFEGVLR